MKPSACLSATAVCARGTTEAASVGGRDVRRTDYTVLAYTGTYSQDGDVFTVDIATKRHSPGQLSVFGIDNVDLKLGGKSVGRVASCRGTTRQAPAMAFEATLIRMAD
jgi:hypothetical protein